MNALDKNSMLALLAGGAAPAPAAAQPVTNAEPQDVFTGLGKAFNSKKSIRLDGKEGVVGRHVFKIENVILKTGTKGTFFIVEVALLSSSVSTLNLGTGYAFLQDPTKMTKFQPWLKGLIRAVLKLDYTADSEARLVAEADAIARAAVTNGILNGHVAGVNNVPAVTQRIDPATGAGFPYIQQNWFVAEAP